MQVRSAETMQTEPVPTVRGSGVAALESQAVPTATSQSAVRARIARRRPVARALVMSREQEYGYVREDMRRLLITAAVLLAGMLVVLFIIEG
jgi:hypothetical protein